MGVIRLMMFDADDLPKVGNSFGRLGLRLMDRDYPDRNADLYVESWQDMVPAEQGLSCSKASLAEFISHFRRPMTKKECIWEISREDLPEGLTVIDNAVEGSPGHMLIVPSQPMTCQAFLELIVSTRPLWRRIQLLNIGGQP